jgi:hypothetical protein
MITTYARATPSVTAWVWLGVRPALPGLVVLMLLLLGDDPAADDVAVTPQTGQPASVVVLRLILLSVTLTVEGVGDDHDGDSVVVVVVVVVVVDPSGGSYQFPCCRGRSIRGVGAARRTWLNNAGDGHRSGEEEE